MPLFEYSCKKCGHTFEALVTGNSKPKCERCGSTRLEKLLSTFSASVAASKSSVDCASGACSVAGSGCCSTGNCPMSS